MTASTRRRKEPFDRKLLKAAFELIKVLAIAFGVGIAWLNLQPYVQLMLWFKPESNSAAIEFLLTVPIISWLLTSAGWLVVLLGAFTVWGCVQITQLLPDLLRNDRENLRYTVETYRQQSGGRLESHDEDPGIVRQLIEFYNNLPARWLKALFRAQSAAFLIDASLAIICYPPLLVDWDVFLAAPNPDDVKWLNVGIIILCVFTANILLWLMTTVEQGGSYFRQEVRNG